MNPSPGPWRWDEDGELETHIPYRRLVAFAYTDGTGIGTLNHDDRALIAAAPEMREMLLKLEWSGCSGGYSGCDAACPECVAVETAYVGDPRPGCGKHMPDCPLGALLERIR